MEEKSLNYCWLPYLSGYKPLPMPSLPTPIISAEELYPLTGQSDLLILDCRHNLFDTGAGRRLWAEAALPGAQYLHLDEDLSGPILPGQTGRHPLPETADFAAVMGKLGLEAATYVVVYDDKGGGIAARLWWMLMALGHERVAVLDGGIQAWEAAGYPLLPGKERTGAPTQPRFPNGDFPGTCDRAQTDKLRQDPAFTLIDSRTAPRYRGEEEPIDPVAGHIEGAINLPWPDNLKDGKLRPREELRERFAVLQAEARQNVFYCGSGVTACHNILAYHYAYGEMPGLYPGSWSEWLIG